MAFSFGRGGRLTGQNGGFRPGQNIRVLCRFRPPTAADSDMVTASWQDDPRSGKVRFLADGQTIVAENRSSGNVKEIVFTFDRVFRDANQEEVYQDSARASVGDVLEGYNATIFAYGQTGAGKTHTMMGSRENPGIIPRSIAHIFREIGSRDADSQFAIKASFVEVYNEAVRDLLNPVSKNLKVHESPGIGAWIEDATELPLSSEEDVYELLDIGNLNRAVAAHAMNDESSRSHSIFMLSVSTRAVDGTIRTGMLNLCDLAGSEKTKKTKATGDVLTEAKNINKSLHALGSCINALSKGKAHVPYRDSKLTRILQESLGGNCKTTVIIACSPVSDNHAETISTCRFAQRAKLIQSKATQNIQKSDGDVREEMQRLQAQVEQLRVENSTLKEETQSKALSEEAVAVIAARRAGQAAAVAQMEALKSELASSKQSVLTMEEQLTASQEAADMKVDTTRQALEAAEVALRAARDEAGRIELQSIEMQAQQRTEAVGMFEDRLHSLRQTYASKLQQFQSAAMDAVQQSFTTKQDAHLAELKAEHLHRLHGEFTAARDRWQAPPALAAEPQPETEQELGRAKARNNWRSLKIRTRSAVRILQDVDPGQAVQIQSAIRGMQARNSAKDLNKAEIEKGGAAAIFMGAPSAYTNLDADETLRRAAHAQLRKRKSQIEELEGELVKRDGVVEGLNSYLSALGQKLHDVVADVAFADESKAVTCIREELKNLVGGLSSNADASDRLEQLQAGINRLHQLQRLPTRTPSGTIVPSDVTDVRASLPVLTQKDEGVVFSFVDLAGTRLQQLDANLASLQTLERLPAAREPFQPFEYSEVAYAGPSTIWIDSTDVEQLDLSGPVGISGLSGWKWRVVDADHGMLETWDGSRHQLDDGDTLPGGWVEPVDTESTRTDDGSEVFSTCSDDSDAGVAPMHAHEDSTLLQERVGADPPGAIQHS
jgi:hypothetical protein